MSALIRTELCPKEEFSFILPEKWKVIIILKIFINESFFIFHVQPKVHRNCTISIKISACHISNANLMKIINCVMKTVPEFENYVELGLFNDGSSASPNKDNADQAQFVNQILKIMMTWVVSST